VCEYNNIAHGAHSKVLVDWFSDFISQVIQLNSWTLLHLKITVDEVGRICSMYGIDENCK